MYTTTRSLVSDSDNLKVKYYTKDKVEWLSFGDVTILMSGQSVKVIESMIEDLTGIYDSLVKKYPR